MLACGTALAQSAAPAESAAVEAHRYGWLSLLPPVLAIVAATVTRRLLSSLLLGVFCGALILADFQFLPAIAATLETHLWGALVDEGHLRVFAFTLLMGALVGLLGRSGGMHGLVDALAPLARGKRGGQLVGWFLGLLIFFDDYANTVLLGNTLRPVTDRLKISREKLAYIVDSTSAPVAGMALVSTWIATELSYIQSGLDEAGLAIDTYGLFLATIPYRFYVWWALATVALVAMMGRDFGPMLAAERRAEQGVQPAMLTASHAAMLPHEGVPHRWINAVLPIVVVVGAVLIMLPMTGAKALGYPRDATFGQLIAAGDSYSSLLYASLAGVVVAVLMVRLQRLLDWPQMQVGLAAGATQMLPGLAVLWLAWSLAGVTENQHLQTGQYLADLLGDRVPASLLPTLVFLLSAAVSFATGTSWGTMALVVPLSITTAAAVATADGQPLTADSVLLLATVGNVLAGSIFGDHCSPISDTTVLSSQASGCLHLAHVETQLPYAMLGASVAVVAGTLPVAMGVSVWLCLAVGLVLLIASIRLLGKRVEQASHPS